MPWTEEDAGPERSPADESERVEETPHAPGLAPAERLLEWMMSWYTVDVVEVGSEDPG